MRVCRFFKMPPLRYRIVYAIILTLITIGEAADALYSLKTHEGPPIFALVDFALVIVVAVGLGYLARMTALDIRRSDASLEKARRDLEDFRQKNHELLENMWQAIQRQFIQWNLSVSERKIAEHLIRGYSSKQTAAMLGKSERTVRNQAYSVYQKSGMTGRSDLAAFFLQDILGDEAQDR